jgi:hypothetical protein
MSIPLNADVANALDQHGNVPLATVHPVTGKVFFVVSAEQFERLKPLFEDVPKSFEEQHFELEQLGKHAGWDDPNMDAYDKYDEHRT